MKPHASLPLIFFFALKLCYNIEEGASKRKEITMANNYYGKLISVTEAALRANVTPCTIRTYIKKGLLPATNLSYGKVRPRWGIREEDLKVFKDHEDPKPEVPTGKVEPPVKPYVHCRVRDRVSDAKSEKIKELKAEMAVLSEQLLTIAARLEELSI